MSDPIKFRGQLIGCGAVLLVFALMVTMNALGRPFTSRELGYFFAAGGCWCILSETMRVRHEKAVLPSQGIITGIVIVLASLEWIAWPDGSHFVSTAGLLCYMIYAMVYHGPKVRLYSPFKPTVRAEGNREEDRD